MIPIEYDPIDSVEPKLRIDGKLLAHADDADNQVRHRP